MPPTLPRARILTDKSQLAISTFLAAWAQPESLRSDMTWLEGVRALRSGCGMCSLVMNW